MRLHRVYWCYQNAGAAVRWGSGFCAVWAQNSSRTRHRWRADIGRCGAPRCSATGNQTGPSECQTNMTDTLTGTADTAARTTRQAMFKMSSSCRRCHKAFDPFAANSSASSSTTSSTTTSTGHTARSASAHRPRTLTLWPRHWRPSRCCERPATAA